MASLPNRNLRLGCCTWYQAPEESIAPRSYRVTIAEHDQSGFLPLPQPLARLSHLAGAILGWFNGDQARKHRSSHFISGIRERRIISRNDLVAYQLRADTASLDYLANGKVGC